MSTRTFRKLTLTVALFALVVLLVAASGAAPVNAGTGGCKTISGRVSLQQMSGPACTSPLGLCATGDVRGSLRGTATIITSSMIASVDTPTTGVVFTTGDTTFVTAIGTLLTKDASTLSATTGEYVELITIVGGTGAYTDARGTLFATGTAGIDGSSGSYHGEICTP